MHENVRIYKSCFLKSLLMVKWHVCIVADVGRESTPGGGGAHFVSSYAGLDPASAVQPPPPPKKKKNRNFKHPKNI